MSNIKYIPTKDKILPQRFSNEDFLNTFPRHKRFSLEFNDDIVKKIIDSCFNLKFYSEIWSFVKKELNKYFPEPTREQYRNRETYCDEYSDYFYGSDFTCFLKCLESEFIHRKGEVRTFEEACNLATIKWVEKIFGTHIQDNGVRSENSGLTMMLGTMVKEKAKEKCNQSVIDKFTKLLNEYYLNGCRQEYGKIYPYSDYGPNTPLYEILVKAGVDKRDATNITPWKTGIQIDENDNSVVLVGYQTRVHI